MWGNQNQVTSGTFNRVNPMQSHTNGTDGHADSKPNGHPAPLTKWIIINGQALIHYNLLFSKKAQQKSSKILRLVLSQRTERKYVKIQIQTNLKTKCIVFST